MIAYHPLVQHSLDSVLWWKLPREIKQQILLDHLEDCIGCIMVDIKNSSRSTLEQDLQELRLFTLCTKSVIRWPLRQSLKIPHFRFHQLQKMLDTAHLDLAFCKMYEERFPFMNIRSQLCACPYQWQQRRHNIFEKLMKTKYLFGGLLCIYKDMGLSFDQLEVCLECRSSDDEPLGLALEELELHPSF